MQKLTFANNLERFIKTNSEINEMPGIVDSVIKIIRSRVFRSSMFLIGPCSQHSACSLQGYTAVPGRHPLYSRWSEGSYTRIQISGLGCEYVVVCSWLKILDKNTPVILCSLMSCCFVLCFSLKEHPP